jgi:hypothetical protein
MTQWFQNPDLKIYGGFDGAPYDQRAQRLIAVARK